ncbi:MAG: phosphoribosyl-ATP diphosphatase [Pseudomonadota bacterium]
MSSVNSVETLYDRLKARADADPEKSYTAKLLAKGPARIAKKVGEEGVEAALAGACGTAEDLAAESADLLYHLSVLWLARGVDPSQVWAALESRTGQSGLDEKASRKA